MAGLEKKGLDSADETMPYGEGGRIDVFRLDEATVARIALEPGWKWSTDVGPHEAEHSCQHQHEGYCLSGRVHVRMDDGEEREFGPGELFFIGPGHDAWVVGDEPWVALDFKALDRRGRAREASSRAGQEHGATP